MTAFRTPVDIGNRALQFCGANRMDPTLGFSDSSVRGAAEVGFVYDKLREAELKRNCWVFATRRTILRPIDGNTMLLTPALWSASTSYFRGCIVTDQAGNLWISQIPSNLNNDPLLTVFWEPYFGPLAVPLYATATAYLAGELVYTAAGDGTVRVYLSLVNNNSDVPATPTTYSASTTYFKNQIVTFSSVAYMSLIDFNLNNEPDLAPSLFNIATTYSAGTKVGASDGMIYQSVGSGNLGNDPTVDGGTHWTNTNVLNPWTTVFTGGSGSLNWRQIGGKEFPAGVSLTTLNIVYPLGAGPSTQTSSRNVFKLPAGFLKTAPQNPKGTASWLGGPSGETYNDWNFENGYLVSAETGPISLRFIADMTDVARMDAMFCEGLAARIGMAVCATVNQSDAKLKTIAGEYTQFMGDARKSDAIEAGYDDPPDDDYLSVRL